MLNNLSIVPTDKQSPYSTVMILNNLHMRHKPCDVDIVWHLLKEQKLIATSLVFKIVKHTRGMRYSPGISTSAVAKEKLLKNLHFSSSRKDLNQGYSKMMKNI